MAEREGPRRRLAPEERKAELLAAALAVFAELGFERATLQDVADRAGVTKGALYHYFDSKNELFIELVRARVHDLVAALDARVTGDAGVTREQLLHDYLERLWRSLHQPHMLELSRLILMELPNFPEAGRAFVEAVVIPARGAMRRILGQAGAVGAAEDTDALMAALPSMILGAAIAQRTFAEIDELQRDQERIGRAVVDTLARGAFAGPQAGR